jgi:4'-phosphopantetheinyl transferase
MTAQPSSWRTAPRRLALESDEVHVWRVTLVQPASTLESFLGLLSSDEELRAESFYFQKDRDRFIVAHGAMRTILSQYLNVPPERLRFCYGPYGKPALAEGSGGGALRFNMSHSHELALCAITREREVGVDLEYIREDFASREIARQFFSPGEVARLGALPISVRTEAFFNCWTRKEAYIKATGKGLSLSLDQFDVSLAPGEPAALLSTRGNPQEASRWALRELAPGRGYVAALAVEGRDWRLNSWQWVIPTSKRN